MTELSSHCDFVLGNEENAEKHFGIITEGLDTTTQGEHVKAEAFLSVCVQMMKKFPNAKKVITTLRGSKSASHTVKGMRIVNKFENKWNLSLQN